MPSNVISRMLSVVLLFTLFIAGSCAKETPLPNTKDIPFISCEVCKYLVSELQNQTETARQNSPYKKLDEGKVVEIIESVCNPQADGGKWIRSIDITSSSIDGHSVLALERPGGISRCESECLTVAKSCQSILEPVELDELSVKLWRGNSADKVKAQLCSSKKKRVCAVARPEVPVTYQRQDFVFKAMKAKDLQMEKLMADMNGAGMGGLKMYNREDMADMAANGMMGYDGDDDDEDDADSGTNNGSDAEL